MPAVNRLLGAAFRPVDAASAAAFRIVFGLLGLTAVVRFFANDWIARLYLEPAHQLPHLGFGWLQPWPGWGMYAHFAALGALSVAIVIGYRYRLCAALFFLGFTYVELLDRTVYLNHYYLVSLVSLLMVFLPLHRAASVDARSGDAKRAGADRPATVPVIALWALRFQIGVVYVFAGIAKLNPDWLMHALPMRIWLYQHGDLPIIGALLQEAWAAYAMSWGGALFDLAIVPALLWRRSRLGAYIILGVFHLATWALFPQLGIFPLLMMGCALIYFAPDWPRRLLRHRRIPNRRTRPEPAVAPRVGLTWRVRVAAIALALFALAQLALPLRHYAYPGNVRWNEEGYRFAWRVMLTEKTGFVQYRVRDPATGQAWLVNPDEYLTPLQAERMAIQPDLILQTAHIIAADFAARGHGGVTVTADAFVAYNGRANARLIDPAVNLAAVAPGLAPKGWVLPYAPSPATIDSGLRRNDG